MKEIRISDETMKRAAAGLELPLSFKEKLELAKLLDNLGVSVISIEGIEKPKVDALRIKSIASLVKESVVAVPVKIDGSDIDAVWSALHIAHAPRLQVSVATSPARMEYVHHLKAPAVIEAVADVVQKCAAHTSDVEFIAEDATRTDQEYLSEIITAAISAGATTITICDDAGTMLPEEFTQFVSNLSERIPQLESVSLGVACSNELYMAVSTTVAAIINGVDEVKVTSCPLGITPLPKLAKALVGKVSAYGISTRINASVLGRIMTQIDRICDQGKSKSSPYEIAASENLGDDISLTAADTLETIAESVAKLGYDLTDEDVALVYEAFLRIASRKETISGKELDAIVATAAMQVPPTYKLERYIINSGNTIKATACLRIAIGDAVVEKVGMGEGPIDAAFAAIDEVVGKTYELDDWQMQAITEGQEAMGEAVIKLMSDGKIYSGRGISTDIIGSSIRAYLNALNKVVFEEEN